jgi:hypothetical protein
VVKDIVGTDVITSTRRNNAGKESTLELNASVIRLCLDRGANGTPYRQIFVHFDGGNQRN